MSAQDHAAEGPAGGRDEGEFARIARLYAPLAAGYAGALGLRDDAALVSVPPGDTLVVTADAIVEGVHYLPDDPPDLVARKLLRVNLSDLAAMGAVPLGYLLTTALPARLGVGWLERFTAGLALDQAEFAVTLLGGDSVATPGPVHLSLTALGLVPQGWALQRGGARIGDGVFVSGTIGDGFLGLQAARGALSGLAAVHVAYLADRYRLPQPRLPLGVRLREVASAALDVSDGLVADLGHVAAASGVALRLDAAAVPLSAAAQAVLAAGSWQLADLLTGGDDYELAFTASLDDAERLRAWGATLIGRVEAGRGIVVDGPDGEPLPLAAGGYRHF